MINNDQWWRAQALESDAWVSILALLLALWPEARYWSSVPQFPTFVKNNSCFINVLLGEISESMVKPTAQSPAKNWLKDRYYYSTYVPQKDESEAIKRPRRKKCTFAITYYICIMSYAQNLNYFHLFLITFEVSRITPILKEETDPQRNNLPNPTQLENRTYWNQGLTPKTVFFLPYTLHFLVLKNKEPPTHPNIGTNNKVLGNGPNSPPFCTWWSNYWFWMPGKDRQGWNASIPSRSRLGRIWLTRTSHRALSQLFKGEERDNFQTGYHTLKDKMF